MWSLWVAGLAALSPVAHASDVCEERHALGALESQLDRGETSFVNLDEQGFDEALHEANLVTRCLSQAITPRLATRLHWMNGLQLYLQQDPQRAAFALAAARSGAAHYTLSADVLPKGHELWSLYNDQTTTPQRQPQPEPKEGALLFDGVVSIERPLDRATVVQLELPDGSIKVTRYVLPGEGLPDYGARVASPELAASVAGGQGAGGGGAAPGRARARALNPWLAGGAGLAVVGAATSFLLARSARTSFEADDPSYTLDDLEGFQRSANTGGAAGVALGVSAVGLGVSAAFVGVWK